MESLALFVTLMFLAEVLFALAVVAFAIVARFRGRFRRTALVLIVLLAIETAWALSVLPAFGFPSLFALALSAGIYWWPKRRSARSRRS
ncbi:MAG: hypothetical protein RL378_964 [Actinomycetota bacterium]|jgi:hypothetical protein